MSAKTGMLEPLRVRLRRLQFIAGLGFFALMVGSLLSGSLAMRLGNRLQDLPGALPRLVVGVLLEQFWVLVALPVLCYGAARILELRPLSTALGTALTGQFFVFIMQYVREGSVLTLGSWRVEALRLLAFAGGVYATWRAVTQARAAATQHSQKLQSQAASRKGEYDAFLRDAEREGERVAQREAARAAVAAPEAGTAQASASAAPVEAVPVQDSASAAPVEAVPVQGGTPTRGPV